MAIDMQEPKYDATTGKYTRRVITVSGQDEINLIKSLQKEFVSDNKLDESCNLSHDDYN